MVWYVRLGKGKRVRIKADYGTAEFEAEYQAAMDGKPIRADKTQATNSLNWLVARYRETANWMALSEATRRQRDNIFIQVLKTNGPKPYAKITAEVIMKGRDKRSKTPFQARHFLDTMRSLFKWAVSAKFVKADPTAGVEKIPHKRSEGFAAWTQAHVAKYQERWPIGTHERVWLDVLLYTGLRRGDVVRLGRQHVRDGIATLKTEKSGFSIEVTLPILPALARTLQAGPCGDMAYICGKNGQPFTKEGFGNQFRKACEKAGVPGSAHGVRKIAATTAANNGATVAELEAIFGWVGGAMASHYTRTADRQRLAKSAMHKLANDSATSIPAPKGKVRARHEKCK